VEERAYAVPRGESGARLFGFLRSGQPVQNEIAALRRKALRDGEAEPTRRPRHQGAPAG
jgi:hypothetical protein